MLKLPENGGGSGGHFVRRDIGGEPMQLFSQPSNQFFQLSRNRDAPVVLRQSAPQQYPSGYQQVGYHSLFRTLVRRWRFSHSSLSLLGAWNRTASGERSRWREDRRRRRAPPGTRRRVAATAAGPATGETADLGQERKQLVSGLCCRHRRCTPVLRRHRRRSIIRILTTDNWVQKDGHHHPLMKNPAPPSPFAALFLFLFPPLHSGPSSSCHGRLRHGFPPLACAHPRARRHESSESLYFAIVAIQWQHQLLRLPTRKGPTTRPPVLARRSRIPRRS